ncbi:MAG: winged helix-turn-helix transcriptional regulator [Nanoarchaeota archaeon]
MIKIRNEEDLKNWFKKNYKKLGFSDILRYDVGICPDFIMKEKGKSVRVELEIKSSHFLLHGHSIKNVDRIICIKKDIDFGIPIIELKNFKLIKYNQNSPYSLENQAYLLFKKNKVVTTSEVAKNLKISWGTANSYLKELILKGKVRRIKKDGVTLWLKK